MIHKVFTLLSKKGKKNAILVTSVIVFQALLEVAGAASIVPLLILFVDSGRALDNNIIKKIAEITYSLGFPKSIDFTVVLISALLVLTILIFLVRSYSSYQRTLFVEKTRFSLSQRLLTSYLSQDYEYFLTQNSNDLSKNLLSEVDQVIGKVIHTFVNMAANVVVGFAILVFLFIVNPVVALVTFLGAGGIYALIYASLSKTLFHMGQDRLKRNKERFIFAGEIFGGIKTIKITGNEEYSVQKFSVPSLAFAMLNGKRQVINDIPSYFIEAFALSGLIVFTYLNVTSTSASSSKELIPLLGLYGYSFYKLKPAVSSIFVGLSSLKYGAKTIEKIHNDLTMQLPLSAPLSGTEKLRVKHKIQFADVDYSYSNNSEKSALTSINLDILSGTSLAIVGSTGSGKTTLTNILLGLLEPTKGKILLDSQELNKTNVRNWQKNIGYVPQDIFMMDASIAENIAFGIPKNEIDMDALKKAAHAARIDQFIESKLADGYDTTIGDRGIRLSGGEKQRVGIARALYSNPDILVFDEATSALDSVTEKEIIEEIDKLSQHKTIIMVAHRLSTVKKCDLIVVLSNGKIETTGAYNELVKEKNSFSKMLNS